MRARATAFSARPPAICNAATIISTRNASLMTSTPILALAQTEDGIGDLETLRGVADPIDYLQKNITAEVGKKSELIYVSLEAHNAVDAAKLVNAVVQAYVTYQTKMQHSTSAEELDILQKEASRDELAIAVKDRELATLRDMFGETAYDSLQSNPIVQQETALSNALTAARLDAVNSKAAYDQALAMIGNDRQKLMAIEAPDDAGDLVAALTAELDLVRSEIFRLEQQLKDLDAHLPAGPPRGPGGDVPAESIDHYLRSRPAAALAQRQRSAGRVAGVVRSAAQAGAGTGDALRGFRPGQDRVEPD